MSPCQVIYVWFVFNYGALQNEVVVAKLKINSNWCARLAIAAYFVLIYHKND